MTDWTSEEDEAFNEVEKHSNLGKQILRDIEGQPYYFDVYVSVSQRNAVLEEVAKEFESTVASVQKVWSEFGSLAGWSHFKKPD